jgi:predicted nucleotidyltransferase
MTKTERTISRMAQRYRLQIVYAFGSRATEAARLVHGEIQHLSRTRSDLDIGVKPEEPLQVEEKVEIALALEELFQVSRVDLVVIPDAPVFLALAIVTGELLYAQDADHEAEYQLYIMRRAEELLPYERAREKMILGF